MEELWKDIEGFEGFYMVSNLGNIKSVDRVIVNQGNRGNNKLSRYKGRILKQSLRAKGYLGVILTKNGKQKSFQVHRLVAKAFVDNAGDFPQVNHKDENKKNNRADNLEWCTNEYNVNYGHWKEKQSIAHRGKNSKKVRQLDKAGNVIAVYNSITEAREATGISHIGTVARGERQSAGGFLWEFHKAEGEVPDDN